MKRTLVQFCERNVTRDERAKLESQVPEARGRMCLANCTMCFDTKFVEIDGRVETGEDFDALLAMLQTGCQRS